MQQGRVDLASLCELEFEVVRRRTDRLELERTEDDRRVGERGAAIARLGREALGEEQGLDPALLAVLAGAGEERAGAGGGLLPELRVGI